MDPGRSPPIDDSEREDEEWIVRDAAQNLYYRAVLPSLWERLLWILTQRDPEHPYSLANIRRSCKLHERHVVGRQPVPLDQIQGSEKRSQEFDRAFRPMNEDSRERWLRAAVLTLLGEDPPPVVLILVDQVYFVRDGHLRVSVSRALGQQEIHAKVIEWQIACDRPLPWRVEAPADTGEH